MRPLRRLIPFAMLPLLAGCFRAPPAGPIAPKAETVPGLENVYRLTNQLYSGSGPEGDEAFAALKRLGVRMVLSVDGAPPDLATARKYGLRYVHIPVKYEGIPDEQAWQMTKAVGRLSGPVYLHCHHGKHRGPAAAAAVLLCQGVWGPDQAEDWLRTAGTDPKYAGLVGLPRSLRLPTAADLAAIPDDFPEAAEPPDMTRAMAEIDAHWDRLKKARANGWKFPAGEPGPDPTAEAVIVGELFREAHRCPDTRTASTGFQKMLSELESEVWELERALRATPPEWPAADLAFGACRATCVKCHSRHRD